MSLVLVTNALSDKCVTDLQKTNYEIFGTRKLTISFILRRDNDDLRSRFPRIAKESVVINI